MPRLKLKRTEKTGLAKLIDRLIRDKSFANKRAIADAIGMTDSSLSMAQTNGKLTVEQCLRLAAVLGTDLAPILRQCGREEAADLTRQVFTRKSTKQLSAQEDELVNQWRRINAAEQAIIRDLAMLVSARAARTALSRPGAPRSIDAGETPGADERRRAVAARLARERRRRQHPLLRSPTGGRADCPRWRARRRTLTSCGRPL
jgi:hypothetical protein